MNFFVILTITINFLNSIHFIVAQCKTNTDCLQKPKLPKDKPIQVGILYDRIDEADERLLSLDDAVCSVIKALGNMVTILRMPGARVTTNDKGVIDCKQYCLRDREDACHGKYAPGYADTCAGEAILMSTLQDCYDAHGADDVLSANGKLRCQLGIDESKLPALIFNGQFYDPCTDFKSEQDLKTFICALVENGFTGC